VVLEKKVERYFVWLETLLWMLVSVNLKHFYTLAMNVISSLVVKVKINFIFLNMEPLYIAISDKEILTFACFCIDQIMPVESKKPITEEDTLEDEECEDEMITVTPFASEPDYEVNFLLLC